MPPDPAAAAAAGFPAPGGVPPGMRPGMPPPMGMMPPGAVIPAGISNAAGLELRLVLIRTHICVMFTGRDSSGFDLTHAWPGVHWPPGALCLTLA
eukprot:gene7802-7999_t